jgi:hypothetical protein
MWHILSLLYLWCSCHICLWQEIEDHFVYHMIATLTQTWWLSLSILQSPSCFLSQSQWTHWLCENDLLELPKYKVRVLLTQLRHFILLFMLQSLFCFLPVWWNTFQWKSLYWLLKQHTWIFQAPFSYVISFLHAVINCSCSSLQYTLLSICITFLTMLSCAVAHAINFRPVTTKAREKPVPVSLGQVFLWVLQFFFVSII